VGGWRLAGGRGGRWVWLIVGCVWRGGMDAIDLDLDVTDLDMVTLGI